MEHQSHRRRVHSAGHPHAGPQAGGDGGEQSGGGEKLPGLAGVLQEVAELTKNPKAAAAIFNKMTGGHQA